MTITERINEIYPNDCFIGGDMKLIVGSLGVQFCCHFSNGDKYMKTYAPGDYIPVIKKETGKIFIHPFLNSISVNPDTGDYTGIIYIKRQFHPKAFAHPS
jgi:hypothetical protein